MVCCGSQQGETGIIVDEVDPLSYIQLVLLV